MEDIKMKKTYIAPNVNVYKVEINNILAGSPQINRGTTTAEEGTSDSPVNLSREGGLIWELEEINDEN